jgi:nitrous oxidase accessory protein NosD
MPPGNKLPADQLGILREWVLQGAPDWAAAVRAEPRKFLTEAELLKTIERDLLREDARSRRFLRYYSIAHLYNAGLPGKELEEYRLGLSKLLNSLSWHPEVHSPTAIDPARTILRIDLRDFNWTSDTWRAILRAYPYTVRTPQGNRVSAIAETELPYVRADWFVAHAALPPLYHDILGLPETLRELEEKLGIDTQRNLEQEKNVARAGIRNSGVSRNNRIVERHVSSYGAYWKSYDFSNNQGSQNIFKNPLRFAAAGGEIIFSLPNGMQAYFLIDGKGNRIDEGLTEIVFNRDDPDDPVVRNGRSCMGCHSEGMKTFRDDIRTVILATPHGEYDREQALALYSKQEGLDQLFKTDMERFARAVERAGGKISPDVFSEPVNVLSRRYGSELSAAQAAAEAGMETKEFLQRLHTSPKLSSLGYGQLLVANGRFKRDAWEEYFGDLARELMLGDYVAPRLPVRPSPKRTPKPGSDSITVSLKGEGNFDSINDAVRRSPAGARILVKPGLYEETVTLDRPVEIIGEGKRGDVTIQAVDASCLIVQSDTAILRNLSLRCRSDRAQRLVSCVDVPQGRLILEECDVQSDSGPGVAVHGAAADAVLRRCHLAHCKQAALQFWDGANALAEDCDVSSSNVGIAIFKEANPVIRGCRITGHQKAGVHVFDGGLGTIQECEIWGNAEAEIVARSGATPMIRQCKIREGSGYGVVFQDQAGGTVEECDITRNTLAGVLISTSATPLLVNCRIFEGKDAGVAVTKNGQGRLNGCRIFSNLGPGVWVEDSGPFTIRDCKINRNGEQAVSLAGKSDATIEGCDLAGNVGGAWRVEAGSKAQRLRNSE